jgi:hypothetical protein
MDRSARLWGWTILLTVGAKAWDGDTATEPLVSLIHAPPQETARPGAGGKQR